MSVFIFLNLVILLHSSADFLLLPENSSSFSLGGITSLKSGVNKNPVSFFSAKGNFVSFSEIIYPENTSISNFKVVFPYKKNYIGFGFNNLSSDKIKGYDESGNYEGDFSVKEKYFNIGYVFKFKDFKFGISFKNFLSNLKDKKASVFAFDIGSNVKITDNFSFDVFISDIGNAFTYESEKENLELDLNLSFSYSTLLDNLIFFLQSSSVRGEIFSLLWCLNDNFILRGGYNFGERANNLFLGLGIGWKNFSIDYSFSQFGEISNINYFTLSYRWGMKNKLLLYKEEIERTRKRALRYYRENKLFKAREEFLKILSVNPNDRDARFYVSRIEEEISFFSSKTEADRLFKEGVKKYIDGDLIGSYKLFSKVLLISPQYKEAKEYLNKVEEDIKEFEKNSLIVEYLEEAKRFERKRDFEKAIKSVNEALNISRENRTIKRYKKELVDKWIALLLVKGKTFLSSGKLDEALKVYKKILKLQPNNVIAQKKIGEIYTLKAVKKGKGEIVGEVVDFEYDDLEKKYYLVIKLNRPFEEGKILILKQKGRIKVLDKIEKDMYNGIMLDNIKPSKKDKIILP